MMRRDHATWNITCRRARRPAASHEGYIDWHAYEENRRMLEDNAHMQKRATRKSGRGGQALLSAWSAARAVGG